MSQTQERYYNRVLRTQNYIKRLQEENRIANEKLIDDAHDYLESVIAEEYTPHRFVQPTPTHRFFYVHLKVQIREVEATNEEIHYDFLKLKFRDENHWKREEIAIFLCQSQLYTAIHFYYMRRNLIWCSSPPRGKHWEVIVGFEDSNNFPVNIDLDVCGEWSYPFC